MRLQNTILSAAVTGLLLGTSGCSSSESTPDQGTGGAKTESPVAEKHACKGRNTCQGKGGCATGDQGCKGKNTCSGKGGCATVAHHDCKGKNTCKGLGGCGSGDQGCKAKNTCQGKGGCAVPIKH